MSGLNEDVEMELANADRNLTNVDNYVQPKPEDVETGANQPKAPAIKFITTSAALAQQDEPTIQELFGVDVVPNELPDLNAKITIASDNNSILSDATSVKNSIIYAGAISQEDIVIVNSILKNYLSDSGEQLGFYTKTASKTRLNRALEAIDNSIDEKQKKQISDIKQMCDEIDAQIDDSLLFVEETILSSMTERENQRIRFCAIINEFILNRDVSGYIGIVSKILDKPITHAVPNNIRGIPQYFDSANSILASSPILTNVIDYIANQKQELGDSSVTGIIMDPENLIPKELTCSVSELLNAVGSRQEEVFFNSVKKILHRTKAKVAKALSLVSDNTKVGEKLIEIIDIQIVVLKEESNKNLKLNKLVRKYNDFDRIILKIAEELVKTISTLP